MDEISRGKEDGGEDEGFVPRVPSFEVGKHRGKDLEDDSGENKNQEERIEDEECDPVIPF